MGFSQLINSWMFIFPIIVILYYFFRKKYKKHLVSSTLFWEEAMQETKASPYLKKLQKNALLFLQLAALIFFVFALMNPYLKGATVAGEQVIIVMDTSATMLAGKDQPLFEKHKETLLELVGEMRGKEVTLITTGAQPSVIMRGEQSENAIRNAIEELTITYEAEQMQNALDITQALIGQTATSVYIFTDSLEKGAIPISGEHVAWHVFGGEAELDNLSITKFAAMEQNGAKTILIQVQNGTEVDQNVAIIIEDEEGRRMEQVITVEKNSVINHVMANGMVGNLLKASIDSQDDYEADNTAYTVVQSPSGTIQLDPNMHLLVQKGLASVYDDVVYFSAGEQATMKNEDMIVTNKVKHLNGNQRVLLFGRDDVEAEEVFQYVSPSNHMLFNFSPLTEVYVQSIYPPFEDAEVIATIGDKPFIQLTDKGDIIVLTDVSMTDWALHPVFPLFLWSAIQQLSSLNDMVGIFTPNQNATVMLAEDEWSIFDVDGQFVQTVSSSRAIQAPSEPGIYTLVSDEQTLPFVVDLSADEKVLKRGESYQLGKIEGSESKEQTNSIVLWFIPVILLLLLIEWEVQRRRGFTN